MKRSHSAAYMILAILALLTASGCDNIGIFATIAVSEYIEDGLLPEGVSSSEAFNIGTDYDFFSSGGALWVRDTTDRANVNSGNRWNKVSLNGWSNVQSIAATDDRIYLTMVRENPNRHEVGLFWFEITDFTPASNSVSFNQVGGTSWTDDGSSFTNVFVFCPNPGALNEVFINVLTTDASFGNTFSYVDSELYRSTSATPAWPGDFASVLSLTSPVRYVSGAAYSATATEDYVFSAIENSELDTDNGLLFNESGGSIVGTLPDRPVTGVTWLDDVYPAAGGAFFAGGTSIDGNSVFPIYASLNGQDWEVIPGSSVNFRVQSFVDVSQTPAGVNAQVLAGTRSFTTAEAEGYVEILAPDGTIGNWSVVASGSRIFANTNNYLVSSLADTSITDFAIHTETGSGDDYLYASTATEGIWHLNLESVQPSWSSE